jgi:alpha-glucosidase
MKNTRQLLLLFFVFIAVLATACSKNKVATCQVQSPDGKIKVSVFLTNGQLFYSVNKENVQIISASKLGFKFKDGTTLGNNMKIATIETNTFNETWEQPWGEKRLIENRYEELTVALKEKSGKKRNLTVLFKVYNDGFGFRYQFPQQAKLDSFVIMDELTEFALPTVENAWWTTAYKGVYYENITKLSPINEIGDTVNTPLTIETKSGKYLAIHEANLTDYAAMNLYCTDKSTLKVDLTPWSTGEKVFAKTPFQSPWRMVIVADKPGDLITSYLELNLNDPCKLKDVSWIKPCKYIGIWWGMHMEKYTWNMGPKHGATTENTMKYIDFAAKHGFGGVLVEGWNYGWENDWTKEGDKFNFTRPYPDFDIVKITNYAKSKGVKLIGHNETGGATLNYEKQMEDGFKMYENLGVGCVKTGYVQPRLDGKERHSSQYGVRHFRKVIETAAKYHIMIDNHEPVVSTGLCRTYPNFMTAEGMRGQEYNAWSADGGNLTEHTTIIPFTRGLAGPMDYTPGVFNFTNTAKPHTRVKTTLCHQLGLYVVLYSPDQMACDLPENYEGNPAFKFIETAPVDWDVTKVIDAKIGDYIITARKDRNSDNWFLGAITDENSRELDIDLSFLDKDKNYTATIYKDGPKANWETNPTDVAIETLKIGATNHLNLKLAPGGGTAICFTAEEK